MKRKNPRLIYIPQKSLLAKKITYEAQKRTMHFGVILTIAASREKYWIPKLKPIAKRKKQKLFWMQKIPYHTSHNKTTRHCFIRQNYKNITFLCNWYRFCRSNHVSQQE